MFLMDSKKPRFKIRKRAPGLWGLWDLKRFDNLCTICYSHQDTIKAMDYILKAENEHWTASTR